MAIAGIGVNPYSVPTGTANASTRTAKADPEKEHDDVVQLFLAEARKTPAERLREDWLKAHNLTEDSLAEMPAEQREAIEKSIAEEIKRQLTNRSDQRGALVDLTA